MIRVGFIGVGGMGLSEAKAFAQVKGCEVAAGADLSENARKEFAKEFPKAVLYEEYRKLLSNPAIDAVVIALPTGLHKKAAEDALKSGRSVLVEKPMARTVAECQSLNETSKKTGKLLMVAQCRRYDPHWNSWAQAVRAGKLGFPILWRHVMANIGPGRWYMDDKMGGGPLIDGAVHNYDFAHTVFGDPVSVLASSLKMDPKVSAVDTGSALIRYMSGNQMLLSWSWSVRGNHLHDIIGPKGFIQFGTGSIQVSEEDRARHSFCCLTDAKGKQKLIKSKRVDLMYVNQARHFLDCIQGKAKCLTPGTEAIKAIAVAEAILKASIKGEERAVKW